LLDKQAAWISLFLCADSIHMPGYYVFIHRYMAEKGDNQTDLL